jgi:hypothetical protein
MRPAETWWKPTRPIQFIRAGEPFQMAVLDAGIVRLRPVMITVGAAVTALFPLAIHGGPLWEPMCYAQIGGLLTATCITKPLVPVIFSICVLDLKIIRWDSRKPILEAPPVEVAHGAVCDNLVPAAHYSLRVPDLIFNFVSANPLTDN